MKTAIKSLLVFSLALHFCGEAFAQGAPAETTSVAPPGATGFGSSRQDPKNILKDIETRATHKIGLIPFSPLQPFRDRFKDFNDSLYRRAGMKLGLSFHHLFQGASNVLPGTADSGTATDTDITGSWELFRRGQPTMGELMFSVEGRWDYDTVGPQDIGFGSVATAGGTANTFSAYDPSFILRNLFYRQGGEEAGWVYRLGKITTDALFLTNRHISPNATFLPNAGTGVFAAGYADSGLGVAGAWYLNDRIYIGGGVADSNGDRFNWGDIGAGQFYKGVELGVKINPLTEKASFSKLLFWHTDGTKDRQPINANTGESGWGFAMVAEQELTYDGRLVLIGRYGRSFEGAAIYDQQAGLHLVYYDPFGRFKNDAIGTAFNWVDSTFENTRDEYNWETFYRFPLLPDVDTTLSYQAVFDPAFTTDFDFSSVYSLRMTTSF